MSHPVNHYSYHYHYNKKVEQESRAVAGNPRDAAVIFDP